MDVINEMSLIDKAKELAMDIHSGQYRKMSKEPYYIHPFKVFQAAVQNNLSQTHKILALLHDTYEDSKNKKYVVDKIKSYFGERMLKLVLILSHDSGIDYNLYLYKLMSADSVAGEIKLLDMIENLKDYPSEKQKNKYKIAFEYIINKNIKINNNLRSKLEKLLL